MSKEEHLRTKQAADYIGVHPRTMRTYAHGGKVKSSMVGNQLRFTYKDLDELLGVLSPAPPPVEAHYVRVSSTTRQETSLSAQKDLLSVVTEYPLSRVYSDTGSGLNDKRRRFVQMLKDAQGGKFTILRITHPDRLTRFGYTNLVRLLDAYGVEVISLDDNTTKSDQEELLDDFMALVASFSGRMYGMRSREHKRTLLGTATKHQLVNDE